MGMCAERPSSLSTPPPTSLSHHSSPPTQGHLEDGRPLTLEIARYLTHDALQDTNWGMYHGRAELRGCTASLTEMGATRHKEQAALAEFPAGSASALPEYAPTNA